MENLLYSLNATLPVFAVIVVGYILNRLGMFNEGFISAANKFVFHVCLPLMIFKDMASTDLADGFDLPLAVYSGAVTVAAFAVIWICARLLIKDRSIIGAFVQAAYRSSVAVMGFAFMTNIYGRTGLMPMIIIGCVPLYNIFAVTVLTFEAPGAADDRDKSGKLKKAAAGIIRNPIILGIIAGCIGSAVNSSGILQPVTDTEVGGFAFSVMGKILENLAVMATPLSLIVIGASFDGREALAKIRPTAACCAVKLLAMPAVFLPIAAALGFRGEALLALVIMLGSPTTPSCYIMAKNMNNDGVLTSGVIAATTLLSSVTLTFWIFLMKSLGLIT